MKTSTVIKRIKAFIIDYFLILIYIAVLLAASLLVSTLTLPVVLISCYQKMVSMPGTTGKRRLGLRVVGKNSTKASLGQLLARNCIKFLPWELAHFFIFRLFYFTSTDETTPDWILTGSVTSQVLSIIYLILMIFNKNDRSIYELISQTRVVQNISRPQRVRNEPPMHQVLLWFYFFLIARF